MDEPERTERAFRMDRMDERSLNELSSAPPRKFDKVPRALASATTPLRKTARGALALARLALPQTCALCAMRSGDALLCAPCMNTLPALPLACPVCASPTPQGLACGACLARAPRFAATVAACRYAFPVDRLVHALKYGRQLALAEPLGDALAAAVLRAPPTYRRPDAIVPLPLAAARQRERGFNQAIEIARVVARRTGVRLAGGLVRTSSAPPQATLAWSERRRNVRGAFACNTSFAGRSVAVVDDVMTSGATLDAAAGALLRSGASAVHAWVVARTLAQ
jgi:ComF family protein